MRNSSYDLEIVKDEEALLFLEVAMENGSGPAEAVADLRMIDNLLFAKRIHLAAGKAIRRTRRGYFKKDTDLGSLYSSIIESNITKKE